MITYLIIGILLVLLAISTPIINFIFSRKYNFTEDENGITVIVTIFVVILFLIFGINCIIRSTLLF